MLDFLKISTRSSRNSTEVFPVFRVYPKSKDLMVRGGDFYAIWCEDLGMWSTNEEDALALIDREIDKYISENGDRFDGSVNVKYMWDSGSGMIDAFHKFCQKQVRDSFKMLDEELIFSNTETSREHYASKKLNYPLAPGSITAYDKLIGTLYTPSERHKLEWAIGSIVSGDSKTIQKFMVLYGAAGTGKSTILNIIQQLFEGYYSVFDAKALGSANNSFALEPFKKNPLVAIQHDGDLSRIEDNTRLNSLVSHELMTVNEKFKSAYENRYKCFLFMGTNRAVKITDAKSGLIRRLIDVSPSGKKLRKKEYETLMKQIEFELGAIAHHCLEVYQEDPGYYDSYIPKSMMGASNDFYNFIIDSYSVFKKDDGTTLKASWEMYKTYVDEAKVPFPFSKRTFKEELKNYFRKFEMEVVEDGAKLRDAYRGFRTEIFEDTIGGPKDEKVEEKKNDPIVSEPEKVDIPVHMKFDHSESIFDEIYVDCLAQYTSAEGTPKRKWNEVTTKLSEINTSKLHYVKVPDNHIVIDFDIKDENGNKSFALNALEAAKWPPTYAELSKSGGGIHLHYIYNGDVTKLSRIYDDKVEIKTFTGGSSLRRKLTKCNNLPIAPISSGLPVKEEKGVVNFDGIMNEKAIRTIIKRHLNKEIMGYTKPSIDLIKKTLDDAYNSGACYDVSDMRNAVYALAMSSSNQANVCLKMVSEMKWKSEEEAVTENTSGSDELVFYDVEVFPNLFLVNYKMAGEGRSVVRLINPKPKDIEDLIRFKLVGYNCRRYDNHMLYACLMGYNNEQLYNLSQSIINAPKGEQNKAFFKEAYNISYTDVYDFAAKKQSLKKWEIELGLKHHELGLAWDEPVPEELWDKVAEYCDDDVLATEAVFNHLSADFTARQILADLAGGTVNDTTNSLTGKIIFGNNRKPQNEFNWRNLAEPVFELDYETKKFLEEIAPEMMAVRHGEAGSLLPYFPGYKFEKGKSTYRGEEVGEGGCVRAKQGMFGNVALLDIASMHPHSALAEVLFGVRYTRAFYDIVYGRVHIKHKAWDAVNNMLEGKLTPYIQKVINGEMSNKDLANALKIAINSVYGLTAAKFPNVFRDPRNNDNIVAKRGALFMLDLKYEVEQRGYTVAHIKTDSIKIPDATKEIIDFVMEFGKKYGYTFEHEATYDRMCLINDAVYIAKYATAETCEKLYGYVPGDNAEKPGKWTATGKQFQVPYTFKTLFSKEDIEFEDLCETKEVKTALYLDRNEHLPDVSMHEKELEKLETKYQQGKISDTTFESEAARLNELIEEGHDYHFIGKVSSFCPIKPGCGGAVLLAKRDNKFDSANGAKDYRWLEANMVRETEAFDNIDMRYYHKLVDDAVEAMREYGDVEWFMSDDPYIPDFISAKPVDEEELPFI